ncbi:hypothetical protein LINGRAHAP2_LOCUS8747 [Linum grandiflorum]
MGKRAVLLMTNVIIIISFLLLLSATSSAARPPLSQPKFNAADASGMAPFSSTLPSYRPACDDASGWCTWASIQCCHH